MLDEVVIDVEIQKTIDETPGGWEATDKLGLACACLWEYRGRRMRVYGPNDVAALQQRLLDAERITGFNIWKFDLPLIWSMNTQDWLLAQTDPVAATIPNQLRLRVNDLLRRVWRASGLDPNHFSPKTHGSFNLNNLVEATLHSHKIGNGADAPKWFQQGLWAKVANYCADDVALERDLNDFANRYGYVQRYNGGRTVKIDKINLPPWQPGP